MAEKYLTRDQVKNVLNSLPPTSSKEDAINNLVKQGYKLQGLNDKPKAQQGKQAGFQQAPKKDGFFQSLARPFVSTAVTGAAALQDTANLAMGNKDAISRTKAGYNVPGFGNVQPLKIGQDVEMVNGQVSGGGFGKETLKTIGTGLEAGSWYAPGAGKAMSLALKQPTSALGKQAVKRLATQRFTQGATQAGGAELASSGELSRAVPSALLGGGFNVLTGKGFDKLGGVIADRAAVKAANRLANNVAPAAERNLASRIMNSIVKPGKKEFNFGKNPGQAAIKYEITGSLDDMLKKSDVVLAEQVANINKIASDPKYAKARVDASGWEAKFDEHIKKAAENGDDELVNKLQRKKTQLKEDFSFEEGQMVSKGPKKTKDLTITEAIDLKRRFGKTRKWDQADPDAKAVDQAVHDAYRLVDDRIDEVAPELKTVNSDISNLIGLSRAIQDRTDTLERQNIFSLSDKMAAGAAGTGAAIMSGGAAIPAMATAGLGALASKAIRSPKVMSKLAVGLSKGPQVDRDKMLMDIINALRSPTAGGAMTKALFRPTNK